MYTSTYIYIFYIIFYLYIILVFCFFDANYNKYEDSFKTHQGYRIIILSK